MNYNYVKLKAQPSKLKTTFIQIFIPCKPHNHLAECSQVVLYPRIRRLLSFS